VSDKLPTMWDLISNDPNRPIPDPMHYAHFWNPDDGKRAYCSRSAGCSVKRFGFLAGLAAIAAAPVVIEAAIAAPVVDESLAFAGVPLLSDAIVPTEPLAYYLGSDYIRLVVDGSKTFTFEEWTTRR
jgi:hypothetical protein